MTRTALFVLAFSLAFVASAQTAPDPAPPAPAPAPDTVTPAPGPEADAAKAATASKAIADRNCLKYTGSRITPRAIACAPGWQGNARSRLVKRAALAARRSHRADRMVRRMV